MNACPASSAQPALDPSAAGAPVADGAPAVDRASACDAGAAGGPRAAAAAPDAAQGGLASRGVELLAPAGSMAALHAAVSARADAVYLGMEAFNARRGADNFTSETLAEACAYAHLRGARVYVTMNVAVLPEEVRAALDAARQAYRAGVDAFIVQDIGLAAALREALPAVRLHISTQMNTHNVAGIEAAARLGASRVTLARELSLGEIELLAREAADRGMEVETFAHGALCVCYSGQCFMSSLIGGRSANRGMCAQACRLPYELRAGAEGEALPAPGEHLLSPRDLCSIDLLPELVRAGAASLKLEGRMKSPDYVHAVTSVYRAVLDRVLAAAASPQRAADRDALRATDEERRVLAEAFSRGFTTAYLEGERGNDIMSYGRPNNRGVLVGRVASMRDGKAAISAQRELACGDVLEFWTKRGHFAYTLDEVRFDRAGNVVTEPDRPVGKGDRVFRVRSAADAFADDAMEPRIAVAGRVRMRLGEPLRMEFRVADGERRRARDGRALEAVGVAEGPEMEPARTKAVAAEDVRAHVDRLGTSPYRLESLDIDLDEGVGVGFSLVHRIRAAALEDLTRQLTEPWADREDGVPRIRLSASRGKAARPAPVRECLVVALATNPACARVAKRAGADAVCVPALEYKRGGALAAGLRTDETDQAGYPKQCVVALPAVEHEACGRSREALVGGIDVWERVTPGRPVLADSLGALVRAADLGALPEAGPHLPLVNGLALACAADLGARRVWLSPELTLRQIEELGAVSPVPLGLTVIGAQELMVTEHCLLMSQGPCNQDCASCARRTVPHVLRDRKGYDFPVYTDALGRGHLHNGVVLDVAHLAPELIAAGVSAFMVDTTLMTMKDAGTAVARAVRARDLALRDGSTVPKASGATTGHLFRGVS